MSEPESEPVTVPHAEMPPMQVAEKSPVSEFVPCAVTVHWKFEQELPTADTELDVHVPTSDGIWIVVGDPLGDSGDEPCSRPAHADVTRAPTSTTPART